MPTTTSLGRDRDTAHATHARRVLRALLALCAAVVILQAQAASASTAYGVTEGNTLVRFDTATPGTVVTIGPVTNLLPGEQILAIDFRPLTGRLYGVSASHVYVIDPSTGQAGLVDPDPFPAPLTGAVGMDFDPVTGAIRIVTDGGVNLRVNPLDGTVTAATNLSATGIVAVAYTNNFAAPDRATLYAINASTDRLVRIGNVDQPDGGASQDAGVVNDVAPSLLGFNAETLAGFDITANDNVAWAALHQPPDAESTLLQISLTTGLTTSAVPITAGARLRAFAVLSRAVTLHGLTTGNAIVTFLSAVPGTLLPLPGGAPVPIQGLNGGEDVLGIETRPATGELFGVTSTGRLLIIDSSNGQTQAAGQVSVAFTGAPVGFDFDPVQDRLRITTDAGQNLLVNPAGGAATAETNLTAPTTVGLAYTAASPTTLYGIDAGTDQLVTFATPSNGASAAVGALGTDAGPATGFDISPADGAAFAAITAPAGTSSTLYTVSLSTGVARAIAQIGGGAAIRGLAVSSPGRVRLSSTTYTVIENGLAAPITVERFNGVDGPITVKLQAAAGTASGTVPGGDFVPGTFVVEFASGETSKTINVIIQNDVLDEPGANETVQLTLSDPRLGASLGDPTTGTLEIVDDDPVTGAAPTMTIMGPTAAPTYEASTLFLTLSGTATDPDGTIASVTWANDRGPSGSASTGPAAAEVQWFANGVQLLPGVNTVRVVATDNAGNQAADTIVITVGDLSYFLAEGATGVFFNLDLLLANPNETPVNITATFLKPSGLGNVVQHYTLPPRSRSTINVESIPGLEAAEVSAIVTAPASTPIIVERTMTWNDQGYGGHTDKASIGASGKWFFAEGSQGFFFTYLLLANPANAPNEVTVRYLREGLPPFTATYPLAALERRTIDLSGVPEVRDTNFGMEVTFSLPGIAERAMYFGLDPHWVGGHESAGVTEPSREWFLAEGATGTFFETFVLFANSGSTAATVDVRYLPMFGGTPVVKQYTVAPGERVTKNIEAEIDGQLGDGAVVATEVKSDVPILVERAQYWPDPGSSWYEAHNSFGVTSLGTRWGLAEGRVGGPSAFSTYILIANTNASAVTVEIDFLPSDGSAVVHKTFTIDPNNRLTLAVGVDVPEITEGTFGAVIAASQPVAVERAMYANANGQVWQLGTNATATRLP